jgi:hypothetical protein
MNRGAGRPSQPAWLLTPLSSSPPRLILGPTMVVLATMVAIFALVMAVFGRIRSNQVVG